MATMFQIPYAIKWKLSLCQVQFGRKSVWRHLLQANSPGNRNTELKRTLGFVLTAEVLQIVQIKLSIEIFTLVMSF